MYQRIINDTESQNKLKLQHNISSEAQHGAYQCFRGGLDSANPQRQDCWHFYVKPSDTIIKRILVETTVLVTVNSPITDHYRNSNVKQL